MLNLSPLAHYYNNNVDNEGNKATTPASVGANTDDDGNTSPAAAGVNTQQRQDLQLQVPTWPGMVMATVTHHLQLQVSTWMRMRAKVMRAKVMDKDKSEVEGDRRE